MLNMIEKFFIFKEKIQYARVFFLKKKFGWQKH